MDRHPGGFLARFIEQPQRLAQPDVGSFCFHPLHSQELSFACWRKLLTELSNLACRTGCTPIHRRVEDGRGGLGHAATLRFPSPLIKPDVRISRIRLSDWFHRTAHGGAPRSVRAAEAASAGRRAQQHRPASVFAAG